MSSESSNKKSNTLNCMLCDSVHKLFMCNQFRKKSLNDRQLYVKQNNLCQLCLSCGHVSEKCYSRYTCKFCMASSSLLHVDQPNNNVVSNVSGVESSTNHIVMSSVKYDEGILGSDIIIIIIIKYLYSAKFTKKCALMRCLIKYIVIHCVQHIYIYTYINTHTYIHTYLYNDGR